MRAMIAFDVAPVFTSGDKVSLVPRATDIYDPHAPNETVAQLTITDAIQAEIIAQAGSYWLIGKDGQSVGVTVPEGHEPKKAPAKKAAAKT